MSFLLRGNHVWYDPNPKASPETSAFAVDMGMDEPRPGFVWIFPLSEQISDEILTVYFRTLLKRNKRKLEWVFHSNCELTLYTRVNTLLFNLDPYRTFNLPGFSLAGSVHSATSE